MSAKEVGLMGALSVVVVAVVLIMLYAVGTITIPKFVCDAAEGICTPTATLQPTATPQPTYTSYPTPTPMPPTATPMPIPATSTPMPFYDLLGGCEVDDFAVEWTQISPVEQYKTNQTQEIATQFVVTNTGICMLVQWFLDPSSGQTIEGAPELLNPGKATTLTYDEWLLNEGERAVTLALFYKNAEGSIAVLEDAKFVLRIAVILDDDGDGVSNAQDACPNERGTAAFNGCFPDTDYDGIPDSQDECPETKGTAAFNGCPDTDGDGLGDQNDCCPNLPGPLSGCPDADGDGYPENNEMGCPGLPPMDRCSGEFGQDANCPGCTLDCRTEYDKCDVEVCETDPVSGRETCRTEQQDCNPHEVCEPCP